MNAQIGELGTKLLFVNSIYPSCQSIAYKVVAFVPTDEVSCVSLTVALRMLIVNVI
jgi:hypothetical protein